MEKVLEVHYPPSISIACWCDDVGFYSNASYETLEQNGFNVLYPCLLSKNKAIDYWKNYYDMNTDNIKLLKQLSKIKVDSFFQKITLNEQQKN